MENTNTDLPANHRVLFHFISGAVTSQKSLLNNLKSVLAVWPDAEIEVVAHGPGIALLTNQAPEISALLLELAIKKVRFMVCEDTLYSKGLTRTDLAPFVETVPLVIAELITKQEQGWSYIRAGL